MLDSFIQGDFLFQAKDSSQSSLSEDSQNKVTKMWVSSDGGECIRSHDTHSTPLATPQATPSATPSATTSATSTATVRKENSYSTGDRLRDDKYHHSRERSSETRHKSHDSRDKSNHKHDDVKKSSEGKERPKETSSKHKLENSQTPKSNHVKVTSEITRSGGGENGNKAVIAKAVKERSLSTEKQRDSKPDTAKASNVNTTVPDSTMKASKSAAKDKSDIQPVPTAFESNLMHIYSSVRALKEAGRPVANLVNGTREEKDQKQPSVETGNSRSSSQQRNSESSSRSDKHHERERERTRDKVSSTLNRLV